MNETTFAVGQTWERRDGKIMKIISVNNERKDSWAMWAKEVEGREYRSYPLTGKYVDDPYDLVKLVSEGKNE